MDFKLSEADKLRLSISNEDLLDTSDSEDHSNSEPNQVGIGHMESKYHRSSDRENIKEIGFLESVEPSVKRLVPTSSQKLNQFPSITDDGDTENVKQVPKGYDPTFYENLEVGNEVKEILQYIMKYTPQHLNLDNKFKPFIPDYIPAVGDIDAFLKVAHPDQTINREEFDETALELGLRVLDEPSANQSDPALLHLHLRAKSVNPDKNKSSNVVVKKIYKTESNGKMIEKWMKDISDLRRSKSSSIVRYEEDMPDLNDLMQEWPDEMEKVLQTQEFLVPQKDTNLFDYIQTVCKIFGIPLAKKTIHSLHLLFCLYAAIKQTQLYQVSTADTIPKKFQTAQKKEADQLVLD